MRLIPALLIALLAAPVSAQGWQEPARGTKTRKALMDALRPRATELLGAPVEFVVYDLRRAGDVAFASVVAQRPGGVPIDLFQTPGYRRGQVDPEFMDGTTLQALYYKSGDTWVAMHWALGATDVWYADSFYCKDWWAVISEVCMGK